MKKLNNKGFSLVELIIVIAIMAILVGVVGTQVIPYLENSRKAKDIQVLSAWNTAAVSAYSTEAGSLDSTAEYKITCNVASKAGTFTFTSTPSGASGLANLESTFRALTDISGTYDFGQMASKAGKAITKVEITINGVNGQVVTVTTADGYTFDPIENK